MLIHRQAIERVAEVRIVPVADVQRSSSLLRTEHCQLPRRLSRPGLQVDRAAPFGAARQHHRADGAYDPPRRPDWELADGPHARRPRSAGDGLGTDSGCLDRSGADAAARERVGRAKIDLERVRAGNRIVAILTRAGNEAAVRRHATSLLRNRNSVPRSTVPTVNSQAIAWRTPAAVPLVPATNPFSPIPTTDASTAPGNAG